MKKFRNILRKVLLMLSALSVSALFIIVLTSAVRKQNELTCKNLIVKVDYKSGLAFLSENEVKTSINYLSGGNLSGKKLSHVDFAMLEKETEKNPYVENAEIFVDRKQNVSVEITQKRPILRILNNDGVGFYISEKNERIPLSDKFTAHVAIAVGNIEMYENAKRDSIVLNALFNLIQYVRKDEFLHALVDHVYVNENGEIDLIPKITGHIIRFGNAHEKIEEKFNRLKIFYKEGMSKVGWDKYKAIDLRYNGQVVCEKYDSINTTI